MRTLFIINAVFAIVLLLLGLPLLFALGITGGMVLVTGLVLAGIASWMSRPSRLAVMAAVLVDGFIAAVAVQKLLQMHAFAIGNTFPNSSGLQIATSRFDYFMPAAVLALMLVAIGAALVDMGKLRAAPWL